MIFPVILSNFFPIFLFIWWTSITSILCILECFQQGLWINISFCVCFIWFFCFPLTFSSNLNLFPQLTCQFIRCLTTWNFNISIPWSSFIEDTYWLTKTAITKCHTLSSFTRENVFTVWCWQCKFKVLKDWLHLKPLLVYLWLSSSWAFLWSSLWISAY